MTSAGYRICTRCVVDTTNAEVCFDARGVCNQCYRYDRLVKRFVHTGEEGRLLLEEMAARMKESGRNKEYDCLIGLSGGVDSTMVAYHVKRLGLRPLAVHLDNGWNSELAVNNIQKALKTLGISLYTHIIDWEEFKDLQLAFLKASTPDSEIPSDHAVVSLMYLTAAKTGIDYVITGRNVRTETHIPSSWSTGHSDWKYIKSVHGMFGTVPLKTYPHRSRMREQFLKRRQVWFNLLNYVDYMKKDSIKLLERELGWQYCGGKHNESIYTRFFQGYILPKKFGFDKRKGHFSSLICSGEMTRDEALELLKQPAYPVAQQEEDRLYLIKKLGITEAEFERIMKLPPKTILDYPSYARDDRKPSRQAALWIYRISRGYARRMLRTMRLRKNP